MNSRTRSGMSLFELLIVLAVIGFLLALLLPAVQKVREAANRMKSANNLKQIALAVLNYESANGKFPPGNDSNNFSAASRLLPYLEQDSLYKLIDFDKPATDKANAEARKVKLEVFLSPRDDERESVTKDQGATNYLFNAGSKAALEDNDGVFYQDSAIRIANITDGTSNTLLAGETFKGDGGTKAVDVRRQHVALNDKDALKNLTDESGVQEWKDNKHIAGDRCSSWMDGRFLQGTFGATRKVNDPRPDVSCQGGNGGLSGLRGHSRAVNAGLCDGSVRFITDKIDVKVWKALATRAGGEILEDF